MAMSSPPQNVSPLAGGNPAFHASAASPFVCGHCKLTIRTWSSVFRAFDTNFCSEGCRDMVVNGAVRTADSLRAADAMRKTEEALLRYTDARNGTSPGSSQPKLLFTSSALS